MDLHSEMDWVRRRIIQASVRKDAQAGKGYKYGHSIFHLDNARHFANMSHNCNTICSGSDLDLSLQNQTEHSPGAGVDETTCLFTQRPAGKSVDL